MKIIEYQDYDKISDDMMYLNNNITMRFNVILSKKASAVDNSRRFFHSEYSYENNKYNNANSFVSIRRSFSYYISFDVGGDWLKSVMIRVQDIMLVQKILDRAFRWTRDGTFTISDQRLIINSDNRNALKIENLAENKYIWLEPIILENDGIQSAGVRMTLSDPGTYSDMTIQMFAGLVYLINTADMFGYAQNMLNYIGRPPEYGFNMVDFDNSYRETQRIANKSIKASPGRQIKGVRNNKSIFEK